jgi:hypothetical protein
MTERRAASRKGCIINKTLQSEVIELKVHCAKKAHPRPRLPERQ